MLAWLILLAVALLPSLAWAQGTVNARDVGQLDDAASVACTENSHCVKRITPARAGHVNLRNQAGTEVGTASAPLRVDPAGTTTQPVSASVLPLPTGAATESTLAGIKTGTDKIPSSPATDRTTAAAPFACRLSDGTDFFRPTTPSDTQPVSGTLTCNAGSGTFTISGTVAISGTPAVTDQHSNVTADYDTGAGTQTMTMYGLALPKSGGAVAGGTSTDPIRIDPTGTTTQPVSGTVTTSPPSNASTNVTQWNGTAVDTNSGNKSAGTIRVVLATDQPSLANAQPASQSGTWTVQPGNTANTTPWLVKPHDGTNAATIKAASTPAAATDTAMVVQPAPLAAPICTSVAAISQTASTKIVSGSSGKRVYICALVLVASAAEIVSLAEGTGSTCGTGSAALVGSTTTANGMSFAANGGVSMVADRPFLKTQTDTDDLCLLQNGSNRVSGFISYVLQ